MEELPLEQLTEFRHTLHQHAETAGQEKETAQLVTDFITQFNPDKVISNIGGHGLAFIFEGQKEGPTVAFRCELDALSIPEDNPGLPYLSKNKDNGHKCGHDGHMSMVSGIAPLLHEQPPAKGRVVLLYQPAEETGEGAQWMLDDPKFKQIEPDYIFALHNLPGFPLGQILLRNKHFAAASKGMLIRLEGETSHAGQPQRGNSPNQAMAELMQKIPRLPEDEKDRFERFVLATVIHVQLGEIAFGTTPGEGVVMTTLRATFNDDMKILTERAESLAHRIGREYDLDIDISYQEVFPATINSTECMEMIEKVAQQNNYSSHWLDHPFRWSEDFGRFLSHYNGALFGLGAGENQPDLHNANYDFPDNLIEYGTNMYREIIKFYLT